MSLSRANASPYDPVSLFRANAPPPFLRDLTLGIVEAYRKSDLVMRDEFDEPERHDLFPHHRRAIIEREMRGVAQRHGLPASPRKNKRKTSYFCHVTCNRVILTASAVRDPYEIVRYAEFRLSYARSWQYPLFGTPDPVPEDAALYALVLHGPSSSNDDDSTSANTAEPGFIDIVFPAPASSTKEKIEYVGGRIHLLAEYPPQAMAIGIGSETEVIADPAEPILRKGKVRKDRTA